VRLLPPADSSTRLSKPGEESAELYRAIREQTPGWQHQAFMEFHGLVRGLMIKALGPHAEVEELVDEVFLNFFEAAQRIRSAETLRSYVVSIAMNQIRTELRARRRRAALYKFSTSDEMERKPGTDDPKAKAALIQLGNVLDELSEEDRTVFLLRSLEGMPIAEVAELMGISEATAHRRSKRASEHVLKKVRRNALLSDYIRDRTGSHDGTP
jgi:RNA polymerase sigma-70 factor, ECF subfamily